MAADQPDLGSEAGRDPRHHRAGDRRRQVPRGRPPRRSGRARGGQNRLPAGLPAGAGTDLVDQR